MSSRFDVIVCGLGAAGSAALHQLALRGVNVLGLDQYSPPHSLGSSHGRSRIIRHAYFEDPGYVPLVQRADFLWTELERATGIPLLHRTKGLMLGPPNGPLVSGAIRSAELHGLSHEVLREDELRSRAPLFNLPERTIGVLEMNAGVLDPEKAIDAFLSEAMRARAEVHAGERLLAWRATSSGVDVETSGGAYFAKHVILALGPWLSSQLHGARIPLSVQRNVLYWFTPESDFGMFDPSQFPVFLFEVNPAFVWYGFPDFGDGVKVALHGIGENTTPQSIERGVSAEETERMRRLLARFLPAANGVLRDAVTCLYTNTPDGHFVIDTHPAHPNVIIASPCSGHGFKFAPAVGEMLADLVTNAETAVPLPLFSASRF